MTEDQAPVKDGQGADTGAERTPVPTAPATVSMWKPKPEEFTAEDFKTLQDELAHDGLVGFSITDDTRDGVEGHTLNGSKG